MVENSVGKGENAGNQHFLLFPHCFPNSKASFLYARRRRDVLWDHPWLAASTSLSGAYLHNYSSYGYEISWVDRSHQGGVQCAGIITLASLIFQLLPFVFFHTWILFFFILEFCLEHISKTILARVMKFHGWIDLIKGECSAQES